MINASPASASSISIGFSAYGCGIVSSPAGTTSATFSQNLAAVSPSTGCTSGTDRNGFIDATLTSAKLFFDSTNVTSGNAADIGGGVNILDYVTIAGGTGTGTLLMNYAVNGTMSVSASYAGSFSIDSPTLGCCPLPRGRCAAETPTTAAS